MNRSRRMLLGCTLALATAGSAWSQAWPTRNVTLVVPFAAGGPTDVVARYGGEEFCVVAVNVENPLVLVEHMRSRVASTSVTGWGKPIRVTMSAGFTSTLGESFEAMVRAADTALYQAKSDGRNCSVEA